MGKLAKDHKLTRCCLENSIHEGALTCCTGKKIDILHPKQCIALSLVCVSCDGLRDALPSVMTDTCLSFALLLCMHWCTMWSAKSV